MAEQDNNIKKKHRRFKRPKNQGKQQLHKAVFLDRDGTIIEEKGYLADPDNVILIENTIPALKQLVNAGFKLVITTNQSGVARKYFTLDKLHEIHRKLETILVLNSIRLDAIYYCPHHPDANCGCRKPRPGMAYSAQKRFNIDLSKSYSMGDRVGDVQFGKNFGGKAILVLTGAGRETRDKLKNDAAIKQKPDYIARDIYDASQWIVKDSSRGAR